MLGKSRTNIILERLSYVQGLGLVFVAVYQRALKLLYVDDLLERMKAEFPKHYQVKCYNYPAFTDSFEKARAELEAAADASKRGVQPKPPLHRKVSLPKASLPLLFRGPLPTAVLPVNRQNIYRSRSKCRGHWWLGSIVWNTSDGDDISLEQRHGFFRVPTRRWRVAIK